jgi:hypothetical protein
MNIYYDFFQLANWKKKTLGTLLSFSTAQIEKNIWRKIWWIRYISAAATAKYKQ